MAQGRAAATRPSDIDRRIGLLFLAFLGLLVIGLLRAGWMGVIQAGTLQRAALTQQVTNLTIPAARGTITDRNGIELATSEASADIVADPYLVRAQDPNTLAQELSPLLNQPAPTLLTLLTKPHTGFVYLAKLVSPQTAAAVLKLRVDHQPANGLSTVPETRRIYPLNWEASQVLGGVHSDGHGWGGLEYEYDRALGGRAGERRIVNDAIGQPISINDVRTARPGATLRLSIDAQLQTEVESVLAGVGQTYQPKGATAIVMNPNTGEILALANWPRTNANDPGGAPSWALTDKAVGFNYEPGSTFKAITVAGALQDGVVNPNTPIQVPSVLHLYDRWIHDAEPHGDEVLPVWKVLQVSSNIGADRIGMMLGAKRFDYWVHRFGFGAPTGIDLPGEQQGIVLHWWQYSGTSMGNLPMGQGESVTPIQMATAYSAIANGGILRPPRIVDAIGGRPTALPPGRRVISAATAAEMRSMLEGVFADGGTASGASIPGYCMAGKTGTANEVINGKYSDSAYAASFIGMVPAQHPQLVVAVLVDRPQGAIYGGAVAAPAFQKIVGWAVPYFGINPGGHCAGS
jgi:cell division protein FtsI/penicillin-binding protein 2